MMTGGQRVGPYEILDALGAGGMGQVYRARDTTLNRYVAIKAVNESVALNDDRISRFRREAQALAALNHPNIAQIYDFEATERADGAFIVMELVDGETLADRISRGPMPVADVVPIARQLAEALEAAHEQGIIHRDLKPSNIKVRPDGTVKVLDFGLAKALGPAAAADLAPSSQSNPSIVPTLTSPVGAIAAGVLLGTAAYMAPEQVRGNGIDRRADIWMAVSHGVGGRDPIWSRDQRELYFRQGRAVVAVSIESAGTRSASVRSGSCSSGTSMRPAISRRVRMGRSMLSTCRPTRRSRRSCNYGRGGSMRSTASSAARRSFEGGSACDIDRSP